jgi:hypothetical protein
MKHNQNKKNMDKIHIKRVKRQKKKVTPKEKLLAGLGVGSGLIGLSGAAVKMPKNPPQSIVSSQKQSDGGEAGKIKQMLKEVFGGIPVAKADNGYYGDWFTSGRADPYRAGQMLTNAGTPSQQAIGSSQNNYNSESTPNPPPAGAEVTETPETPAPESEPESAPAPETPAPETPAPETPAPESEPESAPEIPEIPAPTVTPTEVPETPSAPAAPETPVFANPPAPTETPAPTAQPSAPAEVPVEPTQEEVVETPAPAPVDVAPIPTPTPLSASVPVADQEAVNVVGQQANIPSDLTATLTVPVEISNLNGLSSNPVISDSTSGQVPTQLADNQYISDIPLGQQNQAIAESLAAKPPADVIVTTPNGATNGVGVSTPADITYNGQTISGAVVDNGDGTYKVLDSDGNSIYTASVTVTAQATPIETQFAPSGTLDVYTPTPIVFPSSDQTPAQHTMDPTDLPPATVDQQLQQQIDSATAAMNESTGQINAQSLAGGEQQLPDVTPTATASPVSTTAATADSVLQNLKNQAEANLANAQPTASQVNTTILATPAAATDGNTSQQQVDAYIASQQANGVTISKNSDGSYTSYKATSDGQDIVSTISANDMSKTVQQDILNNLPVAGSVDKAVVNLPLDLKTSDVLGGIGRDAAALEAGVAKGFSTAGSAVTNTITNLEHKVGINVNPNAVDGTKTGITDPTQGPAVRLNDSDTPGAGTPLYKISNDTYVDDSGYVYKQPNSTQNSYVYTGLMMDSQGNLYNANDVSNSQQQTTMTGPGGMALKSLGNGIFVNSQTGDLYDYDQDGNPQAVGVKMDSNGNLNSTPLVNGSDDATANKSFKKDLAAAGTGALKSAPSLNLPVAIFSGILAGGKAAAQSQSTTIYNWATNPSNYNIPGEITYTDSNGQQATLDKFTVQKMIMGVTPKAGKSAINSVIKGN